MCQLKIISAVAITLFAVIAVFGLGISMNTIDSHGSMSNCPFMNGVASICQMNLWEHIAQWQSLFSPAVPVMFLLFSILVLVFHFFSREPIKHLWRARFSEMKLRDFIPKFFDHIHLALSGGILHPKLYDTALTA